MSVEAPQVYQIAASETRMVSVDFGPLLETGELLTGTPTLDEINSADLTLASGQVNTGALTIDGESVAIGEAVQFLVSGAQADTSYVVRVTCGTDASLAQTITQHVRFYGVGDGA